MHNPGTLFSILLALGLGGALPTSPVTAPDVAPGTAPKQFVLEAGEYNVIELIDRSAAYLGRNYIYQDADVANSPPTSIKLQQRLVLDEQGCEEVVSQLAYACGFATMPIDAERGIHEWIYRHGPKRAELAVHAPYLSPDQILARRQLQRYVTTSVPLHHLNASAAQNMLRPFLLGGGPNAGGLSLGVAGDAILLQGFTDQVVSALELIEKIDVAASPEQVEQSWREQVEARLRALEKKAGDDR